MKTELFWPKRMASCFDFRVRTSSFDMHQLTQRHKLAKISRLFRSNSENTVKSSPKNSPKGSPKGSPTGTVTRRRFLRVVKDAESVGEEYDNPHLIRKYTKEYVQEQWSQRSSQSMDDQVLPYSVTGHTILKKPSLDSPTHSGDQSPTQMKHASFKEEVQIIEFDKKGKIETCKCIRHTERLQFGDDVFTSEFCEFCMKKGRVECPHMSSDSEQSDSESRSRDSERVPSMSTTTEQCDSDAETESEQKVLDNHCTEMTSEEGHDSDTEFIVDKFVGIHIDKPSRVRKEVVVQR